MDVTVSAPADDRTSRRSNISDLSAAATDSTSNDLNASSARTSPKRTSAARTAGVQPVLGWHTVHCDWSLVSASVESLESSTPGPTTRQWAGGGSEYLSSSCWRHVDDPGCDTASLTVWNRRWTAALAGTERLSGSWSVWQTDKSTAAGRDGDTTSGTGPTSTEDDDSSTYGQTPASGPSWWHRSDCSAVGHWEPVVSATLTCTTTPHTTSNDSVVKCKYLNKVHVNTHVHALYSWGVYERSVNLTSSVYRCWRVNKWMWQMRCIATWGRPTSRLLLCAFITRSTHIKFEVGQMIRSWHSPIIGEHYAKKISSQNDGGVKASGVENRGQISHFFDACENYERCGEMSPYFHRFDGQPLRCLAERRSSKN